MYKQGVQWRDKRCDRDSFPDNVTFKSRSKRNKRANPLAWEKTSQVENVRCAKPQTVCCRNFKGVRLSQGKLWTVLKYTRLPSEWAATTKESVGKRNLNKQEKKMSPKYSKKGLIVS